MVGILKGKKIVFCSICGDSYQRKLKEFVSENSEKEIENAKNKLKTKLNKTYTCNICKSILKI